MSHQTIIVHVLPEAVRRVLLIGALVAALALSARIQVPMYPVPMTMQTLAVLLVGLLAGPRTAVTSLAAYLALGFLGLPVFASGGGPAYLVTPSTGYLFGFLFAAGVTSMIVRALPSVLGAISAALAGTVAIYAAGIPWLAAFTGLDRAVETGILPFIYGDLLKAGLAIAVWHCVRAIRRA